MYDYDYNPLFVLPLFGFYVKLFSFYDVNLAHFWTNTSGV